MVSQDEINGYFLEVVRWLKSEYGYTQEYIVEQADLAQNAITKIKKGKANAGDETITKLCNAFKLNPDYFYGRSPYKTALEKAEANLDKDMRESRSMLAVTQQPYIDPASEHNAALSAYIQLTNRLTDDLKRKEQEMADRLADKDTIIAEKSSRIATLESLLKEKDTRILDLQRQLAAARAADLKDYPFTVGVAEKQDNRPNI